MSDNSALYIIILAAGKGTRMKSNKAKVLHEVFYSPMLHHVLQATTSLAATKCIVVLGHQRQSVAEKLTDFPVETVFQEEQRGTGHAVLCAEPAIEQKNGCVMILCGDTPLIRQETLQQMYKQHRRNNSTLTVMTTTLADPTHYGRIVCDTTDTVRCIVEEKDANQEQRRICEINAGIYCVDTNFLFTNLKHIGTDNSQGEVYLTDIVTQAVNSGHLVHKFENANPQDVLGVNSRLELSHAHQELQMRRNRGLMAEGISMIQPETIQVAPGSQIDKDVTLHPGVAISGNSVIDSGCEILPGAQLHNCHIGEHCIIGAYSCLNDCTLPNNSTLDPHSHNC